jgi:hypothetical protein
MCQQSASAAFSGQTRGLMYLGAGEIKWKIQEPERRSRFSQLQRRFLIKFDSTDLVGRQGARQICRFNEFPANIQPNAAAATTFSGFATRPPKGNEGTDSIEISHVFCCRRDPFSAHVNASLAPKVSCQPRLSFLSLCREERSRARLDLGKLTF